MLLNPLGLAQESAENGWVALFNGKDLNGWRVYGEEKWIVEGGTILGASTAGKYGYLATEKTYRDFVLRVRFKGEAVGNSGVFFHARLTGAGPSGPGIKGVQAEVDPTPGRHTGGLYESGGRGWLAMPTAAGERALKPGDWNKLEIAVEGPRVVTRLNGAEIGDFRDRAPKFMEGVIALQIHAGGGVRVRWKDIEIREILKVHNR